MILITIASLLIGSNAQITCTNSRTATTTAGPLSVTAVLCSDDNMIYFDIEYATWSNAWFGITVDEDSVMVGDALVYTTGKSTSSRSEALWAYTNGAKQIGSVVYTEANDWNEVFTDKSDGIRIIYKQDFSATQWDYNTVSITFGYAYHTSSLSLTKHTTKGSAQLTFPPPPTVSPTEVPSASPTDGTPAPTEVPSISPTEQPTGSPHQPGSPSSAPTITTPAPTTSPTTVDPTVTPSAAPTETAEPVICGGNGNEATVAAGDTVSVTLVLCAEDEMVYIDIVHSGYDTNWFGIVFGDGGMIGNALVWTTGKADNARELGLYAYTNTAKSIGGVSYTDSDDWTNVFTDSTTGRIIYKQALANTHGEWTVATETISFGYALGGDLELAFHTDWQGGNVFDLGGDEDPTGSPTETPEIQSGAKTFTLIGMMAFVFILMMMNH